jgi:hypothetical protein
MGFAKLKKALHPAKKAWYGSCLSRQEGVQPLAFGKNNFKKTPRGYKRCQARLLPFSWLEGRAHAFFL